MPVKSAQNDFQKQAEEVVKKSHNKKVYFAIAIIFTAIAIGLIFGILAIIYNCKYLENNKNAVDSKIVKLVNQKTRECIKEGEKFYLKPGEPQEKECCDNLKIGTVYSMIENKCIPETIASVCIDCPNSECGIGENRCNCPEDCEVRDDASNWKTYRNEEFGFEAKYPNIYNIVASPQLNKYQKSQGMTYLVYLKHSDVNASISIRSTYMNFNLQDIKRRFAPTGNENFPEQIITGQNTFYFYGPGGGGVYYPDNYFYNLNGKVLIISLDDHYIRTKTLSNETRQLESRILSSFKFIEKDDTYNWQIYRNEEFGFEFEYPDYWGNPTVNKRTIDISDEYLKEIIDAEDLPRIAKNETLINFDGKFCFNEVGCGSDIRIIEYDINSPLQTDCYEGSCNTTNLLEEKKEIEQNSNVIIGNLKGRLKDYDFVPGASYVRSYEVILSEYKFIFGSSYSHYFFNIPLELQNFNIKKDVFLEEISNANPDQKDFADFLETLKKVVATFKFIEKEDVGIK